MVCLIMSLPIFSQKDTETKLVCLPIKQAKEVVKDLREYDFCQQERDSLKAEIKDLNLIIDNNRILLQEYKNTSDTLILMHEECLNQVSVLTVDLENKDDKIKSLRSTRTITILTTVLGTLTPILLSNNN